jgi:hypothetical protein
MEQRRIVVACLAGIFGLACVIALGRENSQGASSTVLSDQNQFEGSPAFDAKWSQTDVQHHVVSTQRLQTDTNKKITSEIERLDGRGGL